MFNPTRLPTIEPAQTGDENAVLDLFSQCIKQMLSQGIDQWDAIYPNRQTVQADLRQRGLFLTRQENRLCGVVTLNDQQSPEYAQTTWAYHESPILVVHRVAILPECQGQGIARQLMAFVEQYGRQRGFRAIRLDSFTKNPRATRLYENLGYQKAGTVEFRKGTFWCFEKRIM